MLCSNKTNPSPFVHPLMPTQAWNNEMCFKEKIANLETVYLNSLLWSSNGHGPVYVQILVARSKANHSCECIPKAASSCRYFQLFILHYCLFLLCLCVNYSVPVVVPSQYRYRNISCLQKTVYFHCIFLTVEEENKPETSHQTEYNHLLNHREKTSTILNSMFL